MSENIRFAKSKVTNLRGPSNSLLFFKNWRGLSASFQNKTGGGGGQAPMDGTPMTVESPDGGGTEGTSHSPKPGKFSKDWEETTPHPATTINSRMTFIKFSLKFFQKFQIMFKIYSSFFKIFSKHSHQLYLQVSKLNLLQTFTNFAKIHFFK